MKVIDVSKHQGRIDWNKVKHTDVEGVVIRAGYGKGHVDEQFYYNIEEVLKYEFPHIGVYWFSYAYTIGMARNEAEKINEMVKGYKDKLDLGVYFDWEYDSMKYLRQNNGIPTKSLITGMNIAFCRMITDLGYKAGYYVNEDYQKNWINTDLLTEYRKWYARYSSKAKPVNSYLYQYSSTGRVDGIKEKVDLNKLLAPLTVLEVAKEVLAGKWGNGATRKNKLESAGYDYRAVQNKVNELLK